MKITIVQKAEKVYVPKNEDAGKKEEEPRDSNCENDSASEQPQLESVEEVNNGSSGILVGFLLLLNLIQLAVIIILAVILRVKLAMQNQSATKEKIEMGALEYELPRLFPKAPEPCDLDEIAEYIMYEDAQVYLQQAKEPTAGCSTDNYAVTLKTESMDTAYGSDSGEREQSHDNGSVDEVDYYSYQSPHIFKKSQSQS